MAGPSPPARRRRRTGIRDSTGPGPVVPGPAGPELEFLLLFATSPQACSRIDKRRRRWRGGGAATAAGPRLGSPSGSGGSPCLARPGRSGIRAAGGARGRGFAKLIKVYTWFAHWCAGGRKKKERKGLSFISNRQRRKEGTVTGVLSWCVGVGGDDRTHAARPGEAGHARLRQLDSPAPAGGPRQAGTGTDRARAEMAGRAGLAGLDLKV
jgi:hypothetical protein